MNKNNRGFLSWGDFLLYRKEHNKKVLDTISKLLNLDPIPHYGDIFSLKIFIERCQDGSFMDNDGIGFYALETGMSRKNEATPSQIINNIIDYSWTHVAWFNK